MSIMADGQSRSFIVHVPSSYTGLTAVPLLFDFHGLGGTAAGQANGSGYRAASEKDGAIHVAPQGIDNAWNVGPCCTTSRTIDDVAFAKALVAKLETDGCIDSKRVYAAGTSMGGGLSHYLACHAADVFCSGGPQCLRSFGRERAHLRAGCPHHRDFLSRHRRLARSLCWWRKHCSERGRYDSLPGRRGTLEKWAALDGCAGATEKGKYHAYCDSYTQCSGGAETLCTIPNGGHTTSDGNIDIAGVGWAMLKRHARP